MMEFSELFSGKQCRFSPNGKFLLCVNGDNVDIRFSDSLLKAFKFDCGDLVKLAKWSGDSALVVCHAGLSILKVFSISSGSCIATLRQQAGSIKQVQWAADHRSLVFLEPHLFRVAVWNLCCQNDQLRVDYINDVQPWAKPSLALSPNGKHLAVVLYGTGDDIESKSKVSSLGDRFSRSIDSVAIFSGISWRKKKCIACPGIGRVGGLEWSPSSSTVIVWSGDPPDPLLVLSIHLGSVIGKWGPSDNLWPGLLSVSFSSSAQFLTALSRNGKVHVLNCVVWCEDLELVHNSSVTDSRILVFQQTLECGFESPVFKKITERPVNISFVSKFRNTNGFSKVSWSSGSRYVASCIAQAPAVVWIWNASQFFQLSCVIVMKCPVQDFCWDPVRNIIAIVDGEDCVVLFNADQSDLRSLSVCTPVSRMLFQATHLNWRNDGKAIVASSDQNSTILEMSRENS